MLHKVILPSASVDKILKCDHSIESNGAVLSLVCVASVSVWFSQQRKTGFGRARNETRAKK